MVEYFCRMIKINHFNQKYRGISLETMCENHKTLFRKSVVHSRGDAIYVTQIQLVIKNYWRVRVTPPKVKIWHICLVGEILQQLYCYWCYVNTDGGCYIKTG